MEWLAKKQASKIASSLGYDSEKEAVIAYGLFAIMQILLTIVLVLLIGIVIGAPIEGLIVCFSASILRKYSGGVHAIAAELCTVIGIIYCSLTAYISKGLLASIYSAYFMAVAIIVIFILAYVVIYKKAPVDSPNKPIKTAKKIKRMRKGSFITISIYLLIAAFMWSLSYKNDVFKSYGIAFLFGIAWQVFTLTGLGFYIIGKINNFYILVRKEAKK